MIFTRLLATLSDRSVN